MGEVERRIERERARFEAEFRQILKSSVQFEKRIRDRWREKCLAKKPANRRVGGARRRVERRLGEKGEL